MINTAANSGSVSGANPPTCVKCATCVKRWFWHSAIGTTFLKTRRAQMFRIWPISAQHVYSFEINQQHFVITPSAQTSMQCKWSHLLPGLPFHHICNQKCAASKHHASRGVRLVLVSMRRQLILVARHFSSVLQHFFFSAEQSTECASGSPLIQRDEGKRSELFPLFSRKRSNLQWDLKQGCELSPSTTHKSVCPDVQHTESPPHSRVFFLFFPPLSYFFPTQLKPERENFPSLFFFVVFCNDYCLVDVIFMRAKWHLNAQRFPGCKISNMSNWKGKNRVGL